MKFLMEETKDTLKIRRKDNNDKLVDIQYRGRSDGSEPGEVYAIFPDKTEKLIWEKDWNLGCWSFDDLLYTDRIEHFIHEIYPKRFKVIEFSNWE